MTQHAATAPLRRFGGSALGLLAHPRSMRAIWARGLTACLCIAGLLGVLIGEVVTPANITFGGFSLLIVLAATWLLPLPYYLTVMALGVAVPLVAGALGGVDPITAKFQISATVAASVLAVMTVRSLRIAEEERRHWHDALMRFTADAAHELRSPLTLMRSTLEHLLRRERSADAYRDGARTVLAEVERLIEVSNSLLVLAQSDAGQLTLTLERVQLGDLLGQAVERFAAAARAAGLQLSWTAPPGAALDCDSALVGQVLDNLIDNALKNTPSGGHVDVAAAGDPAWWTIWVQDSGPGIPEALRDRLFERFSRASNAGSPRGTGLGLALCAAIAKAHGGRMSIDPQPATGTRVILHLPTTPGSG